MKCKVINKHIATSVLEHCILFWTSVCIFIFILFKNNHPVTENALPTNSYSNKHITTSSLNKTSYITKLFRSITIFYWQFQMKFRLFSILKWWQHICQLFNKPCTPFHQAVSGAWNLSPPSSTVYFSKLLHTILTHLMTLPKVM